MTDPRRRVVVRKRPAADTAPAPSPRTEETRRAAILQGIRAVHGAQWQEAARRQLDVARRAADDFEGAGDRSMAAMLRAHAAHLAALAPARKDGDP